jgi:hypothetical protein
LPRRLSQKNVPNRVHKAARNTIYLIEGLIQFEFLGHDGMSAVRPSSLHGCGEMKCRRNRVVRGLPNRLRFIRAAVCASPMWETQFKSVLAVDCRRLLFGRRIMAPIQERKKHERKEINSSR